MAVPPKPKRMSEKRYRELYDSDPRRVEVRDAAGEVTFRATAAGDVSAEVIAKTYRAQGLDVTIRPAD